MGGTGFAVFFGSNTKDALVAAVVSILIVYVGDLLSKREDNLMVYNTLMAFMGELIIILASRVGLADHPDRIMIGIVMLLISGSVRQMVSGISFRVTLYQDFYIL